MSDYTQALVLKKGVLVEIPDLLVKEDGTLLNAGYYVNRFKTQVFTGEKLVKTRRRNSRVPYLEFSHRGTKYLLHRVLASTFKEVKDGCNEVRHLDDDIYNNVLDNLEWGTRKQNAEDAVSNGKMPRGASVKSSFVVEGSNEKGEIVHTFCGRSEIESNGFWQSNIHKACRSGKPYRKLFWRIVNA